MKMSLIVVGALALSFLLRQRSAALRHWVLAAGVACAAAVPLLRRARPVVAAAVREPSGIYAVRDPCPSRRRRIGAAARAAAPNSSLERRDAACAVDPRSSRTRRVCHARHDLARGRADRACAVLADRPAATGVAGLTRASRSPPAAGAISPRRLLASYGLRRPCTPAAERSSVAARHVGPRAAEGDSSRRRRRRGPKSARASSCRTSSRTFVAATGSCSCRPSCCARSTGSIRCSGSPAGGCASRASTRATTRCMSRGVEGTDYATHLIDLARALNQRRHTWFPAPAMARPSSLERRVRAMLNEQRDRGSISRRTRAAVFVLLFGVTTAVAAAQSGFASFSGSIADESARGIPATTVTLTNEARQAKYEVKTNADGRFEFVGLPPGDYVVEAKGVGFQDAEGCRHRVGPEPSEKLHAQARHVAGDDQRSGTMAAIRAQRRSRSGPRQPNARNVSTSGAGGYIVPPKKMRDLAPTYPAESARHRDERRRGDAGPHRARWIHHRHQPGGRCAPGPGECGDRGGARVAAIRKRCSTAHLSKSA